MTDNLNLWNAVEKTPPSQTKPITGKSYSGTSPKPHYLVWKATETFGPCGIGWGFNIVDERIEEGPAGEKMSLARVRVWYEWNGKRGEVEHVGGTPFSGTRSSGKTYMDEDAPKKSVTDALIKALSMIGFAGDIFMGRYDDSKYVTELKQEEREGAAVHRQQDNRQPPPQQSPQDFWSRPSYALNGKGPEDFTNKLCSGLEKAPSQTACTKLWEDNEAHIKALPEELYQRCQKVLTDRMAFWSQHPTGKVA